MTELVLSLFPGVLLQSQLLWSCNTSVDHRMMIWAQHPDIILLSIFCSNWSAVSMLLVMQINNTRLSAHCTTSRNIRVANEVAVDLTVASGVLRTLELSPCRWVPFIEFTPAAFHSFPRTVVGAVFSFPVVDINPWEWVDIEGYHA